MKLALAAASAALICSTTGAAAPLEGSTVRLTHEASGFPLGPLDVVVGPGPEGFVHSDILVDVGAAGLRIDFVSHGTGVWSNQGLHLFDLHGSVDAFVAVTAAASNVPGFDASHIRFDGDNIYVDYGGLSTPSGSFLAIDIVTASVPAPPAAALMLSGLAALGARARRRR
jgi:MYXO-CTERM domain-containing protein